MSYRHVLPPNWLAQDAWYIQTQCVLMPLIAQHANNSFWSWWRTLTLWNFMGFSFIKMQLVMEKPSCLALWPLWYSTPKSNCPHSPGSSFYTLRPLQAQYFRKAKVPLSCPWSCLDAHWIQQLIPNRRKHCWRFPFLKISIRPDEVTLHSLLPTIQCYLPLRQQPPSPPHCSSIYCPLIN